MVDEVEECSKDVPGLAMCLPCRDVYFFFRGQGGTKQVQQDAALAVFRAQMQTGNTNRV